MAYSLYDQKDMDERMKRLQNFQPDTAPKSKGLDFLGLMSGIDPYTAAISAGLNVVGAGVDYLQEDADKRNQQRLANAAESEQRQIDKGKENYIKSENATAGKREGFGEFSKFLGAANAESKFRPSARSTIFKALGW